MGLPGSMRADIRQAEAEILDRLLGLYEEERLVYHRILELSRNQGELLRQGAPLGNVRRLLDQKKVCLETIRRLELTEARSKQDWERGQHHWSAAGKARLHGALRRVGELIEDILQCEESNDMVLIGQAREF